MRASRLCASSPDVNGVLAQEGHGIAKLERVQYARAGADWCDEAVAGLLHQADLRRSTRFLRNTTMLSVGSFKTFTFSH